MADLPVTRQQAALELLRRKRSRASLVEYARSVDIPGAPVRPDAENEHFKTVETSLAIHHRVTLEAIEQCVSTFMGRLIICEPPGSAKSTYASVVTPAWLLSRTAGYRVILASYAAQIAEKQSRKARALCREAKHVSIWPDRPILANDQKAVKQWALSNGSEYMAAGLLAGITGNRANGIILDDPIAGREAADSLVIRDKTWDEYQDSVTTRLLPGGWVIIIQTRWNEDDLVGRILPEDYKGQSGRILGRDGQWWTVLNIPAKAEHPDDPLGRKPGEYLWPEWFSTKHWAQWENNPRAARTWSALFQQRPTLPEGLEFKREWFKWYDPDAEPGTEGARPKALTIYGASDFATKENKGDFTEHGIVGLDSAEKGANFYFLDWWFGQKTTDIGINNAVALIGKWKPRRWWDEGGPIDNAIRPAFSKAMREAEPPVNVSLKSLPSIRNKTIKLSSFQARAAQGKVYLPLKRAWATRLLDALCRFPNEPDDAADVCGLLGRGVDDMMSPHDARNVALKKGLIPFTGEWIEAQDESMIVTPRYA